MKMMETSNIIDQLRGVKPYLQEEYGVKSVGLFGSYASGNYTDHSDIDILVEFERPVGWRFFILEKFLETTLQRKIDLVTGNALRKQMKSDILGQIHYI
jgi:predicted nucleotidyltransferase